MTTSTATLNSLPTVNIFPKHSVNLLTGPTSIGKTFFVTHLINNYKKYFSSPVNRIFIVLCNERIEAVPISPDIDLPVEQVPLSEFQVELLEENDLVLIDDVQQLSESIKLTISVCTHHYNLASLFVVTHSLLGSANFELLNLCHRVFLFLRASANIRLAKYIVDNFYSERDIKEYLKTVIAFCSREKNILCLELNPVAQHQASTQQFLGYSHLTEWTKESVPYFLLYPMPIFGEEFTENFKDSVNFNTSLTPTPVDTQPSFPFSKTELLPANTCVVVPASAVILATSRPSSTENHDDECMDKSQWEKTLIDIEENIEDFFPSHKWRHCKNLVKELLRNPKVCVTTNGRFFHLVGKPRTKVNLLSFVSLVSRRAAPAEKPKTKEWSNYMHHVDNLLRHDTPVELFTNKLLLPKRFQKQIM